MGEPLFITGFILVKLSDMEREAVKFLDQFLIIGVKDLLRFEIDYPMLLSFLSKVLFL